MLSFRRGARRQDMQLPLFPLRTVLYPGSRLPLKVFEQRYAAMTKACLQESRPFGVCLITHGDEVADARAGAVTAPQFAPIGTLATIVEWDVPQLGIMHLATVGGSRFQVQAHALREDGLVVGEVTTLDAEPARALPETYRPLSRLLQRMCEKIGPEHIATPLALDDASWVSYRLAELLPLPLSIKQSMLETNDSEVRLAALMQFLRGQKLL